MSTAPFATIALEGATDPAAWGQAFGALGPGGVIVMAFASSTLTIIAIMGTIILIWRGSTRLGIVGLGTEIREDARRALRALDRIAARLGADDSDPDLRPVVETPAPRSGRQAGRREQRSRP